jgi:small subunit ribosomal protein S11
MPSSEKPTTQPQKRESNQSSGKTIRSIKKGQAHIQSTYNNTIVSISDMNGNVLAWCSSGSKGFKGSKKSTPYAATVVVTDVIEKIQDVGMEQIEVYVKGIGSGREAAVRALQAQGLEVISIKDVTPVPHNGCRPRKVRRV